MQMKMVFAVMAGWVKTISELLLDRGIEYAGQELSTDFLHVVD